MLVFFVFCFFLPPCQFPYYPYLLFFVLNILIYIQTDKCNKTPQACHSLVEGNDNRHFYSIVVWFDETRNKLNSTLSWRRRKMRRASIPDEGDKLSKEKWFQSKESFLFRPPRTSISSNLFRQIPLFSLCNATPAFDVSLARRPGHMVVPTENRTNRHSQALPPCSRNQKRCVLPPRLPCHLMGLL